MTAALPPFMTSAAPARVSMALGPATFRPPLVSWPMLRLSMALEGLRVFMALAAVEASTAAAVGLSHPADTAAAGIAEPEISGPCACIRKMLQ